MPAALDLRGKRFGRLVAVARVGTTPNRRAIWHCECDCGGFTRVSAKNLAGGYTRSCGCLYRETRSTAAAKGWRVAASDWKP